MRKIIKVQYFFDKIKKDIRYLKKIVAINGKVINMKDQFYILSAFSLFRNKFLMTLKRSISMGKKMNQSIYRIDYMNKIKYFSFLKHLAISRKLRKIRAFHSKITVKSNSEYSMT